MPKAAIRRKTPARVVDDDKQRKMAAGEFKAKCLGAMAEVARTGKPLLITKRGEPFVEVGPPRNAKKRKSASFIGRLEGKYTIHGDLLEPVFPLEVYDMLK